MDWLKCVLLPFYYPYRAQASQLFYSTLIFLELSWMMFCHLELGVGYS
jgi:hypothetical protein